MASGFGLYHNAQDERLLVGVSEWRRAGLRDLRINLGHPLLLPFLLLAPIINELCYRPIARWFTRAVLGWEVSEKGRTSLRRTLDESAALVLGEGAATRAVVFKVVGTVLKLQLVLLMLQVSHWGVTLTLPFVRYLLGLWQSRDGDGGANPLLLVSSVGTMLRAHICMEAAAALVGLWAAVAPASGSVAAQCLPLVCVACAVAWRFGDCGLLLAGGLAWAVVCFDIWLLAAASDCDWLGWLANPQLLQLSARPLPTTMVALAVCYRLTPAHAVFPWSPAKWRAGLV